MLFTTAELQLAEKAPVTTKCGACKLHLNSPKMQAYGEGKKGILIIGDVPSATEIKNQKALTGLTSKYLKPLLAKQGIDYDIDCRRINVIACKPTQKCDKYTAQIEHCRAYVWEEIEHFKPKVILLLGDNALNSFLNHRWHKDLGDVKRWRGFTIPDQDANAWVVTTYHPAYLELMQEKQNALDVLFENDIKKALSCLDKKLPQKQELLDNVEILDQDQAINWLRDYYLSCAEYYKETGRKKYFDFDYETTGLKPHKEGHYIYCCAIAYSDNKAVSFMVKDNSIIKDRLRTLLQDERIEKEAANMKFEYAWSKVHLNCNVKGLVWDTMQMAHVLDNRVGVTGLKFQAYVDFGILDYDSHITQYWKSDETKSGNAINRIHLANPKEMLLYCGMDALIERKEGVLQRKRYKQMQKDYGLC